MPNPTHPHEYTATTSTLTTTTGETSTLRVIDWPSATATWDASSVVYIPGPEAVWQFRLDGLEETHEPVPFTVDEDGVWHGVIPTDPYLYTPSQRAMNVRP